MEGGFGARSFLTFSCYFERRLFERPAGEAVEEMP